MIILNLICLISRNMAAPQQIEQVRMPSVCTCFPARRAVKVFGDSMMTHRHALPLQQIFEIFCAVM